MNVVCLDMEGVLVPEIWIAFAEASGIPELKRTTRDEPDYNKLMNWRLGVLKEHGLGLKEIQATIATIDPLPGAREFLDALREETQVIILSDTFEQFAKPLMKKLNWPTLFCNTLEVAPQRRDHRLPDALPPVQADHREGPSVLRLRDHRRRGQLQRPGHDPGQQGGLPVQEHRRHQGRPPRAARL